MERINLSARRISWSTIGHNVIGACEYVASSSAEIYVRGHCLFQEVCIENK